MVATNSGIVSKTRTCAQGTRASRAHYRKPARGAVPEPSRWFRPLDDRPRRNYWGGLVSRTPLPSPLKAGIAGALAWHANTDGSFDDESLIDGSLVKFLLTWRYWNRRTRTKDRPLTPRAIRYQLRQCEHYGLLILVSPAAGPGRPAVYRFSFEALEALAQTRQRPARWRPTPGAQPSGMGAKNGGKKSPLYVSTKDQDPKSAARQAPPAATGTKAGAQGTPVPRPEKSAPKPDRRPPDTATLNQVIVAVWAVLKGQTLPATREHQSSDERVALQGQVAAWLRERRMVTDGPDPWTAIDTAIEHVRFQQQRRRAAERPTRRAERRPQGGWPANRYRPVAAQEAPRIVPGGRVSRAEYHLLVKEWRDLPTLEERNAATPALLALEVVG